MANEKYVFVNRLFALAGRRISKDANKVTLSPARTSVDISACEDVANRYAKGPRSSEISVSGVGTQSELALLTRLASEAFPEVEEPFLIFHDASAVIGGIASFVQAQVQGVTVGGERAGSQGFDAKVAGNGRPYLYASILQNNVGGAAIGTNGAASSGVNLGALTAGKVAAFCVQVVDPPGITGTGTPTITLRIESDDNSGFTSAVTRATFTARTTAGGQILEIDGDTTPISDTYWRLAWTVSGTTPGFTVMAAGAIETR